MAISKQQHEAFARFFEEPTREALRDLIKTNIGETDYLDFKETWPESPKLAKHILSLANSGGGAMVIGVSQEEDGSVVTTGLPSLQDKADIAKGIQKFLPKEIRTAILDFSYKDSEYPALKGKSFQVLLVEHDPKYLPFLSLSDGDGIKKNVVYVRNGTSSTEATHEELQKIINKRLETGHSTEKVLNLTEHLDQLKVLDKERPNLGTATSRLGELFMSYFDARSKDYKDFVNSLYSRKKKLIERDLGL